MAKSMHLRRFALTNIGKAQIPQTKGKACDSQLNINISFFKKSKDRRISRGFCGRTRIRFMHCAVVG